MKIIYLISRSPAYDLYHNQPKPSLNWSTESGSWVGIWGYDWGHLLGNAIKEIDSDILFEVWQPDLRADKLYAHSFENGLIHKSFPAKIFSNKQGGIVFSSEMLDEIRKESKMHKIIFHLGINPSALYMASKVKNITKLGTYHGTINLPINTFFKLRKRPIEYLNIVKKHFFIKKSFNYYSLITYQNKKNLKSLKNIYKGPIEQATMGVDFLKYKQLNKLECREELNLPSDRRILLSVGRINSLKQIDKLIDVCDDIGKQDYNFLLVIVGSSSDENYMNLLEEKAKILIDSNKILFTGFKSGNELVKYYNAADLFIMSSRSEGCSVSSMEAIACGVPVFSTNTGYIAELMIEEGVGKVVEIYNFKNWTTCLKDYLKNKLTIKPMNREFARQQFSWEVIAKKFIEIYSRIS